MSLFSDIMLAGGSDKIGLFPDLPGNAKGPWFAQLYHKKMRDARLLSLDAAASDQIMQIEATLTDSEKWKMIRDMLPPKLPLFIETTAQEKVGKQVRRGILVTEGVKPSVLVFHTFIEVSGVTEKPILLMQNTSLEINLGRIADCSSWDEVFEQVPPREKPGSPLCLVRDNRVLKQAWTQADLDKLAGVSAEDLFDKARKHSPAELLVLSYAHQVSALAFVSLTFWLHAARIIRPASARQILWTQRRKTGASHSGVVSEDTIVFDMLRVKEIQFSPARSGEPSGRTCGAHEVWAHKCVSRKTGKTWTRRAHVRGSGELKSKTRTMRGKGE